MFNVYLSIFLIFVIEIINCNDMECDPYSPKVNCSFLPLEFVDCKKPLDLNGNYTQKYTLGYGCAKFGGYRYEDVEKTLVNCTVLPDIECCGNRTFQRKVACVNYSEQYFLTALLYSILLGMFGIDRFYLGHTGTAVGKLLTLGGLGIWWIIDVVLIITNSLTPEDGSNWNPYA